jgi:hypothetical protein
MRIKTGPPHSDAGRGVSEWNSKQVLFDRQKSKYAGTQTHASNTPKNKNKQVPSTAHTHTGVLKSQAAEWKGAKMTGAAINGAAAVAGV